MRIPQRLRYPAMLATCGLASFALALVIRWPESRPERAARDGTAAPQWREDGARREKTSAETSVQAASIAVPAELPVRVDPIAGAVAESESMDASGEPTAVMLPAPTADAGSAGPGENIELVEGEPVTPPP